MILVSFVLDVCFSMCCVFVMRVDVLGLFFLFESVLWVREVVRCSFFVFVRCLVCVVSFLFLFGFGVVVLISVRFFCSWVVFLV